MPELAEVKLMTEFFNSSAGTKRFRAVHKSVESKGHFKGQIVIIQYFDDDSKIIKVI